MAEEFTVLEVLHRAVRAEVEDELLGAQHQPAREDAKRRLDEVKRQRRRAIARRIMGIDE